MSSEERRRIEELVKYIQLLEGDEKGEAQVLCDRIFQAFGHAGYKEAGASLEFRLHPRDSSIKYADLIWKPRLLMEMKRRGERLERHYQQVFEYWLHSVPNRPQYVVLCNFDEFWIYDLNSQLYEPVEKITLEELPERYQCMAFLFPEPRIPLFGDDRVAVSRAAADKVAGVYRSLVSRGVDASEAQVFALQCAFAMFSEDSDLLPRGLFSELISDCRTGRHSTYDLLGGLFRQMGDPERARAGRFRAVPYFNGGLFRVVSPIELDEPEISLVAEAAAENWSKVSPAVFGSLFQSCMRAEDRHAYGAHFTSEADIQRIIQPTIVRPWQERIDQASTLAELRALRNEIGRFRVLDPACGCGNFLYIAYRELRRLEYEILRRMLEGFSPRAVARVSPFSQVRTSQFFGIDTLEVAVEIARVTMMFAKELALDEGKRLLEALYIPLGLQFERPLPLDDLDQNILRCDALLSEWPAADVIVGNPPYQSKNKMQEELGPAYLNRLRDTYPDVPGNVDYCVYWFRTAHDKLRDGQRAGLVGTNTISQTASREAGLDYITRNRGTITEAVSTQVWSGDAEVHVSIVNWVKGSQPGKKRLFTQLGDSVGSPWVVEELDEIPATLSSRTNVSAARSLTANANPKVTFQGQTPGRAGFLFTREEAEPLLRKYQETSLPLFPLLSPDDILESLTCSPGRYVIDFHPMGINEANRFPELLEIVSNRVLPEREFAAKREAKRNAEAREVNTNARINCHHERFLDRWWQLSYPRAKMLEALSQLERYIACPRHPRRSVFVFVDQAIRPGDALQVFALGDDYSFGILQSRIHWAWLTARCSTLKRDYRYTSSTVFDSFPWPQQPSAEDALRVAEAGRQLRGTRSSEMAAGQLTLRELLRLTELPGLNPVKDSMEQLDHAVAKLYGIGLSDDDILGGLKDLNAELAAAESAGKTITGPGLPVSLRARPEFHSADCISAR